MSSLGTQKVQLADWHKRIREIMKQIDRTNIKILSAMWKYGPRNLLEVSRRTGIPFTSVYHRVGKLERKSIRFVSLAPKLSKLGLMSVAVLVTSTPGAESRVMRALKIPNLWRCVNACEGSFTHFSVNYVPAKFLGQFKAYVRRMAELKLITQSKIILTGEYIPSFPNFQYYDPARNQWTFQWGRWLAAVKKKPTEAIEDPTDYVPKVDKNDVLIVKELQKNGRRSFAELAPILGMTLQGVKYHYDKKLVPAEIVKRFSYEILPYPEEVSGYHEILLEFTTRRAMNSFYSALDELFFVLGVAKVLRKNSLLVRTFTLQEQIPNLFTFLSEMARGGLLESYSSLRQDFTGRDVQTVSYELFDEEKGWTFNLDKAMSDVSKLARLTQVTQKS